MKYLNLFAFACSFVLTFLSLFSISAHSDWRAQMQVLRTQMEGLAPNLYSNSIEGPQQKDYVAKLKAMEKEVLKLDAELTNHTASAPDKDPTLPYMLKAFRRHISRSVESAEAGNYLYSRDLYRSGTAFCIACHTRNSNGVHFPQSVTNQNFTGKNWLDRMLMLTSSRQFDEAISEFRTQLTASPKTDRSRGPEVRPIEVEKGARLALAISLRVQNDPKLAKELVTLLKSSPMPSMTTKKLAETWANDIDTLNLIFKGDVGEAEALMNSARKLIGEFADREFVQGSPEADIKLMAVSQLMNALLLKPSSKLLRAEAYFYLGIVNEAFSYLGLWSLHEIYYEACIEELPHSALAQKCLQRYKGSLTFEFAGSFAERLLPSVRAQIAKFEKLADPKR